MTLNYNMTEVKEELKSAFAKFIEWQNFMNSNALDHYSKGMESKNNFLQKLFHGTDGRIVIKGEDFAISQDGLFEAEFLTYSTEKLNDDLRAMNLDYEIREGIHRDFVNVARKFSIKNKKVSGKDGLSHHPYNGQKVTKVLNSIIDNSFLSAELGSDADKNKSVMTDIKNKIVGGEIASLGGGAGLKGKKVVISIRPADFFLISYGNSWRSCMHPDGGEYNNGVLGYIHGADSFVAYVLGEDEEDFLSPREWRQIMYITDKEELISQKGYPNSNIMYSSAINQTVTSLLGWEESFEFTNKVDDIYNGTRDHYGYVDLLQYGRSALTGAFSKEKQTSSYVAITISAQGKFHCLECGDVTWYPASCSGVCDGCHDEGEWCECCEQTVFDEFLEVFTSEGNSTYICSCCVEDEASWSDHNGCYIIGSNSVWSDHYDDRLFESQVVYSDEMGTYILKGDAVYSSIQKSWLLEDQAVLLDDADEDTWVSEDCADDYYLWELDCKYHDEEEDTSSFLYKEILGEFHEEALVINRRISGNPIEKLADEFEKDFFKRTEKNSFVLQYLFNKIGLKSFLNDNGFFNFKKEENEEVLVEEVIAACKAKFE